MSVEERIATSTHYLRYFIFGGYLVFLSQLPKLLNGVLTLNIVSNLGLFVSCLCIAMDWRNYSKYRKITKETGFPIISVLLSLFYAGWLIWFLFLPSSEFGLTFKSTNIEKSESPTNQLYDKHSIDTSILKIDNQHLINDSFNKDSTYFDNQSKEIHSEKLEKLENEDNTLFGISYHHYLWLFPLVLIVLLTITADSYRPWRHIGWFSAFILAAFLVIHYFLGFDDMSKEFFWGSYILCWITIVILIKNQSH
ncbi:hypothetical protein QQ008_06880 [Fulvivirgaceae bacterium BMA10]|uniref:Uncharacterized protein n=1 Tax=Splendidivirga corallicola TaxID=3051826 RepID=A0ABT8KK37_9BACT|nr:hypothetical protein [Fulvivirgaceae bacterium BMA10]